MLTRTDRSNIELYHLVGDNVMPGPPAGLRGDCTGLVGDCSDLVGDLNDCGIIDSQRAVGVDVNDLVEG